MLRNIVLSTVTVVALAFVAYSTPAVATVLAAGVQLKTGLSDLVGVTDSPEFVLVKEGGEGKGGKGGKGHANAVDTAMAVARGTLDAETDTPTATGTTLDAETNTATATGTTLDAETNTATATGTTSGAGALSSTVMAIVTGTTTVSGGGARSFIPTIHAFAG